MAKVIFVDDDISFCKNMCDDLTIIEEISSKYFNEPLDFIKNIEHVIENDTCCIVVDYNFNCKTNGIDVLKALNEKTTEIKLILYSGNCKHLNEEDKTFLVEKGIVTIEKPQIDQLLNYISISVGN